MLGGNFLGMVFTSSNLYYNWPKIRASMHLAMENPEVLQRIVALGVVSALGQFCIYSAIRILGSLSFTWIMTARQLLSVLISLIFFGPGLSQEMKWIGPIGRNSADLGFKLVLRSKLAVTSDQQGQLFQSLRRAFLVCTRKDVLKSSLMYYILFL